MKKTLLIAGILALTLGFGIRTAHAQPVSLDEAIQGAARQLALGLVADTRIAVLSMESDSIRMSDYLIEEMIAAFVNMQRFTVVDRVQLDLLAAEMEFQLSGDVDDETAQSIGRILGVQSIITGRFEPFAGNFRFRAQVLEVQTAAIRGVYSANVRNDHIVASLLAADGRGRQAAPRIRQPREPRVRQPGVIPNNWLSAEVSVAGGGLRYERMVTDRIAIGVNVHYAWAPFLNFFDDYFGFELELFGNNFSVNGTFRFFPMESGFHIGAGLGYGIVVPTPEWGGTGLAYHGLSFTPELGWRINRRNSGFFANPFIAIPIVVGGPFAGGDHEGAIGVGIRAGVGLGVAW